MKRYLTIIAAPLLLLACGTAQNFSGLENHTIGLRTTLEHVTTTPSIWMPPEAVPQYVKTELAGSKLLIYFHRPSVPTGAILTSNPPITEMTGEENWREVYGIKDGAIVHLGREEPKPVTVKQTNVIESTTYEYPNP